jgi:predicted metal-dependent hydrolase
MSNGLVELEINGERYSVERILTKNRNAIARLRGRTIIISLPSKWTMKDKDESFANLLKRSVRSIAKGRWTVEGSRRLTFSHGQMLCAMGKTFHVSYLPADKYGSRLRDNIVEVKVPAGRDEERAAAHVKKHITRALMPKVKERIDHFNRAHFQADVKKINIRDNLTLWGSCSPDGTISLNFRLLFMPLPVLDYVIVHELAHTKYRSHGKRFWGLVGKVYPGFEEHRKWLRENGWSVFSKPMKTGQLTMNDFCP